MRKIILMLIPMLFLSSCSYWPHSWSEQKIRQIVREEIQNEVNYR